MSKTIEGKISNQSPKFRFNSGNPQPVCECCFTLIPAPDKSQLVVPVKYSLSQVFVIYSYLQSPYFIYESNSGKAVVYCSDKCRKAHNHRFRK